MLAELTYAGCRQVRVIPLKAGPLKSLEQVVHLTLNDNKLTQASGPHKAVWAKICASSIPKNLEYSM